LEAIDVDTQDDKNQALYNAEYIRHRKLGDDPMNARLRLMEQGATREEAEQAQYQADEGGDEDSGEYD
jgi:hypothetical protein